MGHGKPRGVLNYELARLAALWLVWSSVSAFAQLPTATILGIVKDTSGAVVPGAALTATHLDTGQTAAHHCGFPRRGVEASFGSGKRQQAAALQIFTAAPETFSSPVLVNDKGGTYDKRKQTSSAILNFSGRRDVPVGTFRR